eukprot:SAG31_NODE_789_length_12087_cov_5.727227_9_plen_178_part_00
MNSPTASEGEDEANLLLEALMEGKDCCFLDVWDFPPAESPMYAPRNPGLIEKVSPCRPALANVAGQALRSLHRADPVLPSARRGVDRIGGFCHVCWPGPVVDGHCDHPDWLCYRSIGRLRPVRHPLSAAGFALLRACYSNRYAKLLSRFCATIREVRDFNREKYGTNRESVTLQALL